jgi:LacI family transcriptional regulator
VADKRHNIQDIARLARVGVGTVSRVLNDHPNVKDATRQHVLDVMQKVDYAPNFQARYIRTKRSQLFGFISDAVATTPFAVNLIKGAQDAARASGRLLLMVDADGGEQDRQRAVDLMLERDVEGLVYAAMYHQRVTLPEKAYGMSTVLVDCFVEDASIVSVVPDEVQGGFTATEHLLSQGHRRVGLINVDRLESGLPAAHGRLAGYKQALEAFGVPFEEALVRFGDGTGRDGYRYTNELLKLPDPPTALFCGTDRIAMGAYDAIKERGLKIPDDVAVVGFDNQDVIAEYLRPALTTVALPHYDMGRWAVERLTRRLAGESLEPVQHKMSCPLIHRESA